jgi:hypothetical protein
MSKNPLLFLPILILLDVLSLLYSTNELSISYQEAKALEESANFLYYMVNYSLEFFGRDDFGLRAVMIIMHSISIVLLYGLLSTLKYNFYDKIVSVAVFILIPGVYISGLLINESIIIIISTLIFLILYEKQKVLSYMLLPLLILLDNSFIALYFSLVIYATISRKKYFFIFTLLLFVLSLCFDTISIGGRPKSYFIDIIGWYAILCSPFVFIAYFYASYRKLISGEKSTLLYVSFFSFVFALILSFRQNINMVDFVPFIVLGIPIGVATIGSSMRIRLPIYRKKYIATAGVLFFTVFINYILVVENKALYGFMQSKSRQHFAYKYHNTKELASRLKNIGIYSITSYDKKLLKRVAFYGIKSRGSYMVGYKRVSKNSFVINIKYGKTVIEKFYVTKLNS